MAGEWVFISRCCSTWGNKNAVFKLFQSGDSAVYDHTLNYISVINISSLVAEAQKGTPTSFCAFYFVITKYLTQMSLNGQYSLPTVHMYNNHKP